jgi:hypothetical protein
MTQKELVKLAWKHKRFITPKSTKSFIMAFINEAIKGNNSEWVGVANEYLQITKSETRNKKLKALGL